MSLWKIAWRSIQQRLFASTLTMISMALGVTLVVAVLTIHGVVTESFRNNSSLGYNVIVGPKGGKLQLVLNSVYYLSQPIENIPYDYFLEFKSQDFRQAAYQNSLGNARQEAASAALAIAQASGDLAAVPGLLNVGLLAGDVVLDRATEKALDHDRAGEFSALTHLAIPLCLGDYYGKFRVVGTIPEMFDSLEYGDHRRFEFSQGRNFKEYDEEHGYFEAVVGSKVARAMNIKLGDGINPAHGDPEGHTHGQQFTVVGILAPSGTPNDRAVFVNMEGFYLMDGHEKPLEKGEEEEGAVATDLPVAAQKARPDPLVTEQREITAMLVRTINPLVTPGLQNRVNEGSVAQVVLPIQEIYNLLEMIVVPIQQTLLVLTALICIVSGIGILVSIYNSMSERRRDIAIMRALGANRWTVGMVILLEAAILSVGGGLLGMAAGHTLNAVASRWVEDETGVTVGFFTFAPGPLLSDLLQTSAERLPVNFEIPYEVLVIGALVVLAMIVGFLPAVSAYRTDVSKSLAP